MSRRDERSNVRTTDADIVMMDLSMHGMNGVDATRAIKKIAPTCAIVVFTSSDASGDVTTAFDAGADGYLRKMPTRTRSSLV